MVERGKRSHNRSNRDKNNNENNRNQKRRLSYETDEKTNNKDDNVVVYRILCPSGVIGSVIGKSGKVINVIRQETRARIKVVDPFPGCSERVITIYCSVKEKKDIVDIEKSESNYTELTPLCSAQEALLKVHSTIVSSLAAAAENTKIDRDNLRECRILVPSSQCSNVIGKSGSTIKKIRSRTGATVKIVSKDASDPSHICAMDFDNIVLISGEAEAVKRALFAVSAIMYKFSPREQIPLDTSVQEVAASIIIPSDLSVYPQTGLYPNQDPVFQQSFIGYGETAPVFSSSASAASAVPMVHHHGFGGSSRSGELVVKVLCSSANIGRVIGKGGSTIKGIRQTSGAHIEVNDSKANRDEDDCVIITVTAKEAPDDLKSMAVEAVLLLQEQINDKEEAKVKMQLLVPSKVIGCIIGKSGSIISEIRKRTNADIYISKGSHKPKCADPNDELVEISGDVAEVRDALIQIVLRLRDDVLRDRETGSSRNQQHLARSENNNNSFFSSSSSISNTGLALPPPSFMSSVPQVAASVDFDRRQDTGTMLSSLSGGGLYGYGSFPASNNSYGSNSSYSSNIYGGLAQSTTMEIRIPSNAVGKVMGKGGGNLDNIRRISGAMIEISDSKNSHHGGRTALVSGTPEQKRTAENLFQAFIMST
ncbi:unnamed protein product [Microthlaspi erraticum]|uniref:K Homology domain-containing protein n=1 Tax=Microthlaspi erraticum TaxID=1685480 RepID=A0A6D2I0L1_9BRAS|nr:unnamed protein product [Microthlaspi erraticum]